MSEKIVISKCSRQKGHCKLFPLTVSVDNTESFFFFVFFNSMFVERMEVLEYRQIFEVELSTFPDSTNTETPRKLVFSLTCVCVCVRKILSVDILQNSRPIWMKITV